MKLLNRNLLKCLKEWKTNGGIYGKRTCVTENVVKGELKERRKGEHSTTIINDIEQEDSFDGINMNSWEEVIGRTCSECRSWKCRKTNH